ncbi:MAG: glycoside hydrolase family protein [Mariprofundus sp.]|nr:glycoside hydrolase family protein [Mariprofundus sp.]
MNQIALEQIKKHEGLKLKPYRCTADKLTIGYGRNIEDKGITKDEALTLLHNDITEVEDALNETYDWFKYLDEARQAVVINMAFNLGMHGFGKFKNMIEAIARSDYHEAAMQMIDSKWARQVGHRAFQLASKMDDEE